VVVLPQLVTTGYAFESAQEARGLADRADGPSLRAVTALAAEHDLVIVGGFAELAAGRRCTTAPSSSTGPR
jgi:predicted amidohydrolase